MKERAFDEVAAALKAGEIVCIFPEGKITDDGELGRFRPGLQRILRARAGAGGADGAARTVGQLLQPRTAARRCGACAASSRASRWSPGRRWRRRRRRRKCCRRKCWRCGASGGSTRGSAPRSAERRMARRAAARR